MIYLATQKKKDLVSDLHNLLDELEKSKKEYDFLNNFTLFFSGSLIIQFLLKMLYNIIAKNKIRIDKWTILDTL